MKFSRALIQINGREMPQISEQFSLLFFKNKLDRRAWEVN